MLWTIDTYSALTCMTSHQTMFSWEIKRGSVFHCVIFPSVTLHASTKLAFSLLTVEIYRKFMFVWTSLAVQILFLYKNHSLALLYNFVFCGWEITGNSNFILWDLCVVAGTDWISFTMCHFWYTLCARGIWKNKWK